MRRLLRLLLLYLLLASSFGFQAHSQVGIPRVIIASGGPYLASDTSLQRFRGSIDVPGHYIDKPLSLVFTNGSSRALGFNWVRVFLQPGAADANILAGGDQSGRLLVDEKAFVGTAQVYLDMTAQLNKGHNRLYIEGAGPAGSVLAWELRSEGAPVLSPLNPRNTVSGASLTLAGFGFSIRPEENIVQLGPASIPVVKATYRSLKIAIPAGFSAGTYGISVRVAGFPSNTLRINVLPGPEVTGTEFRSVVAGQQLAVYGKSFSETPAENIVYVGRQPARLINCSESTLTITVPQMPPAQAVPVTVFVRGAQANGQPEIAVTR